MTRETRVLETTRLLLRPLVLADAPAVQRHFPHWEIVRWLDAVVPWPYPEDGARDFLAHVALAEMAAGTAWHWSIRRKTAPEELIGVISLRDKESDNRGFWIGLSWQGHGFMSEANDAVTDFWFDVLGKAVLRVPKARDNAASRRLSEKQGMRLVEQMTKPLVAGETEMDIWELTAGEWAARRKA
jgi:[ribosomal protein S5]-alanine N-acetyltransferase